MAAGLLFGSLAGPWLTLALPIGIVFALFDRRIGVRSLGAGLTAGSATLALAVPGGGIMLAAAIAATVVTGAVARAGRFGLARTALPALGGAGLAIGLIALAWPALVAGWESTLERAVREAGVDAFERYRALGLEAATVSVARDWSARAGRWSRLAWPALVALPLWLGAWLGHRVFARWGRSRPGTGERFGRRSFSRFRLDDGALWATLLGLAAAWLPDPANRVAIPVLVALLTLHGLQGLALTEWWLEGRGTSGWARWGMAIVLMALALPFAAVGLVLLGLAIHWLDPREPDTET